MNWFNTSGSKRETAQQILSLILVLFFSINSFRLSAQYGTYDIRSSGLLTVGHNQTPNNIIAANGSLGGVSYQWEQSDKPLTDFAAVSGANSSGYNFSGPLPQTTYFRRITYSGSNTYVSNTLKIEIVSLNWENRNYVREHDILVEGQTDWKVIDQLPIGQKLQTTTYMDGLGRAEQKVSRETATPANPAQSNTLWGDVVQFTKYDQYGRIEKQYLPYTTTSESGKHKSGTASEQPQYYTVNYNETFPYSQATYDASPLNRVTVAKLPGTSWAASAGYKVDYDLNETGENIQQWTIDYTAGSTPVNGGTYPANSLYKSIGADENGKKVIKYTDKAGRLILTKTQLDNAPSTAHSGWICVYNVYDGFGRLRYVLQPEAVKWLDNNGWSFSATNGSTILAEQCFRYEYDDKARTIRKKAPGAIELKIVYDKRDRVVFMQDGNQAAKPIKGLGNPEWTTNIYDELDRIQLVALYHTTASFTDLQNAAANAGAITTVTTTVPEQPINNLIVSTRPASNPAPTPTYTARQTIDFINEFESLPADEFVAEINPTAVTPATIIANTVYRNPISQADLDNSNITTIVKYLFYDDYSYSGVKSFNNNFQNSQAYSSGGQPIAPTARTTSLPTGVKVRVLGTNTFLSSTLYYDEDELPIQSLEDNIKGGVDITTSQYAWDGRLLSTHSRHSAGGTAYTNFSIITKNIYDKIGRVTSLQKKIGDNPFKTIATYDLDDMGRLKTKHLDPDYSGLDAQAGGGLESLAYNYNIHGNITGINKDYALKAPGYDKWGHYFGLYLGYDNRDNHFNAAQLDGHVTGLLWSTMGDDAQRKYDFQYDNAGRLVKADFKQKEKPSDAWDNSKLDFSVGGNAASGGKITYDLNGNLQNMLQRGVQIGNASPITMDDLQYEYQAFSNKLKKVTDAAQSSLGTANGQWGDFKDGSNGSNDDYVYDDNGNLVIDLNKNAKELANVAGADGIRYNFLDKPEEIRIAGKGTIKIVYDADATRLQKIFITEGSTPVTKTTTYINSFVYEEKSDVAGVTKLQYINFEEGRIRVVQPTNQSNGYDYLQVVGNIELPEEKQGTWDYMIRDYQQNVRMIVTEETHVGSNKCTMEPERSSNEEPVFGQNGSSNEVTTSRFVKSNIPGQPWVATSGDNNVSKLSNGTQKIGPNTLLKVMAGDKISTQVQYYYQNAVSNSSSPATLFNSVISSLVQTLGNTSVAGTAVHNGAAGVGANLNGPGAGTLASLTDPNASDGSSNQPKAYLTVLFFDERMQLVSENSSYQRVQVNGSVQNLALLSIKAPKNGYAYVYVSNESTEPVYFDNLQVLDTRGRIVEEDHYYAYGLKIAAISSAKLPDDNEGHTGNFNLYNNKELFEEADLDWYDYGFRFYDPQIGRFPTLDPLTDKYVYLTPYQYASCEPIANIDLDGMEGVQVIGSVGTTMADIHPIFQRVGTMGLNTLLPAAGFVTQAAQQVIRQAARQPISTQSHPGINSTPSDSPESHNNANIINNLVNKQIVNAVTRYNNEHILDADMYGNGHEGTRSYVENKIKRIFWNHTIELGEVVRSGPFATIGYYFKGERGALYGATVFDAPLMGFEAMQQPKFEVVTEPVNCFIAGTLIWTDNGDVAIEKIKVNENVFAYDTITQKVVKRIVTQLYVSQSKSLVKILFENDSIYATEGHPFYINNTWIAAKNITVGDSLFTNGIKPLIVKSTILIDTVVTVYNFTVYDTHNYFITKEKILVHNNSTLLGSNWTFNPEVDVDMRGTGTYKDALNEAFKRTGIPKEQFSVTEWGKDGNGKSIPVEWTGPNGASVNMDIPSWNNVKPNGSLGNGPYAPHVGYQLPGKGTLRRGHIFTNDIPSTR